MEGNHSNVISERGIKIKSNKIAIVGVEKENTTEYSLNENLFDPSKSSPSNEFMIKLYMRINKYNLEKGQ